jgi:hypothetical protein
MSKIGVNVEGISIAENVESGDETFVAFFLLLPRRLTLIIV